MVAPITPPPIQNLQIVTRDGFPTPVFFGAWQQLWQQVFGAGQTAWTPTIQGSVTAGSASYGRQVGTYIQRGPQIIASFSVQLTSLAGMAGTAQIGGLPAAAGSASDRQGGALSSWGNVTLSGGYTALGVEIAPGANAIDLIQSGSAHAAIGLPTGGLSATTWLVGSIQYFL